MPRQPQTPRIPLTSEELKEAQADLEASRKGLKASPSQPPTRGPATKDEIEQSQRKIKDVVKKHDTALFGSLGNSKNRAPLFRWIAEPIVSFPSSPDAEESLFNRVINARKQRILAVLASQPLQVEQCEELLAIVEGGNHSVAKRLLNTYQSRWMKFWHRELGLGHKPAKALGTTENLQLGQRVAETMEKMQSWFGVASNIKRKVRGKNLQKQQLLNAQCPVEYVDHLIANKTAQMAASSYVKAQHAAQTGMHLSLESIAKYYRDFQRDIGNAWALKADEIAELCTALNSEPDSNR